MRKSVVEFVSEHAAQTPEKIAVISNGTQTTYKELFELVHGYCNYLHEMGIKKGDIVVTRATQNLDYVVLYLSVHLSGGVFAPLERNIPNDRLFEIVKRIGAKVIIDDATAKKDGITTLEKGNILKTARKYESKTPVYDFPHEDDSADILFTTGTTGSPKGVEHTHKSLSATVENVVYGFQYTSDTVVIVPGPLNHASGTRKMFTSLANGNTFYILNGMTNMKKFFDALMYPNGTIGCVLPPAAIRTIFQNTGDKIGEFADRVDFIESTSSPLPEIDKERLCRLLPNTRLYNNYGTSESATVCLYDYNHDFGRTGCVGKPMPNSSVLIVDDNRNIIQSSRSNPGLIACKGITNMKGYVNDPVTTAEVMSGDIVYTNDIGYIDEDGYVYILGRKGDVINVGGLKVAPTEVEAAALAYGPVEDCICIGIDDHITGKALKLLVVVQDETHYQPKELRKYLLSKLEQYKVPMYYERVSKIEKTYNGKLNRKYYAENK